MPELVPKGPDIPVDLLNQLDDERVVFFCGAGVSMGGNSKLPGFRRLLCHVYQSNYIEPDDLETEALRTPAYDKAFELLERQDRLGSQQLYESVVDRLSVNPVGPLQMHRDLLTLSRVEGGHRLVTTNFDNRFREAAAELPGHGQRLRIHDAPALPVPNRHRWRTLVHLHGRIQRGGARSDLVLTSADFGRAYLTERWAAKFVTALFRDFTVVFVGYSLSDPVMKYLVDAVAAERAKGDDLGMAYAFVGCDPDKTAQERAGWMARNVRPILYDKGDDHRLLRDTFRKWVHVRSDPRARTRIALQGIDTLPEPGDREVVRVTWALERLDVAQALAKSPPFTDEQDFLKIERWLDEFAKAGLLGRKAVGQGTPGPSVMLVLVDGGTHSQSPAALGNVTYQLACWISRNLHVPQVLGWVLHNGGRVHPELRREIRRNLANPPKTIPPRLRHLWTVLLSEHVPDPWRLVFLERQYQEADSAEKRRLAEALLRCLAPRLVVRPGPNIAVVGQLIERDSTPVPPIEAYGHLRVRLDHDDGFTAGETLLSDDGFLCRHAERITAHLADALVLLREDAMAPTDPVTGRVRSLDRPWIAADADPDDPHDDWTRLIDVARDSYFALAKTGRARASALLRRWAASNESFFRRLVLHVLTEDDQSEIGIADALLLRGTEPGLWNLELRNEVLRFLNLAGSRLPKGLREGIVKAIHTGPAGDGHGQSGKPPKAVRHAKASFLQELQLSGATLDTESGSLAQEVAAERPMGRFDDVREVFSREMGEIVVGDHWLAPEFLDGPEGELEQALCDETLPLRRREIDALVRLGPRKVLEALRGCAERGRFPTESWKHLMWHIASVRREGKLHPDLADEVARLLSRAPDDLFRDVGTAAAGFVQGLGEDLDRDREPDFRTLWDKAWLGAQQETELNVDNPVTRALNHVSGMLAEAALFRLRKHTPRPQMALPSSVRPYFDTIAEGPDGHFGRALLAARLNLLFAIDPEWTGGALVRRLDPSADSTEALDLWAGFAWSPKVGPNLLAALKPALLAVLARDDVRPRTMRPLVSLLVAICLDAPKELAESEVRSVMDSLSEESLCRALGTLESRLTGSSAERAKTWRSTIGPWLNEYWPREGSRNTARSSASMMRLVIAAGDAFDQSVLWSTPFLKPIETHAPLGHLKDSKHVQNHPSAVLDLLDSVVNEHSPPYARSLLREILDAIPQQEQPGLSEDPRFRRLYGVAAGP